MCRWLVWCSEEGMVLSDVVLNPTNSLLHQSFNAGFHPGLCGKNNMTLNADGFGIGWYGKRGAAIYRSINPAWNNRNLRELCDSIESKCIFAHVRAATPGAVVNEENCHPFRYGPLLFQHNGHVEEFPRLKRRIMAAIRDDVYEWIDGTTDSQACFALVLSLMDPEAIKENRLTPDDMRAACLGAIAMLRDFSEQEGITKGYSTYNFALADGKTVVVTRYCDKAPRIPPPSLYYAFLPSDALRSHLIESGDAPAAAGPAYGLGRAKTLQAEAKADGESSPKPNGKVGSEHVMQKCESGAFVCASEPLTRCAEQWTLIAENSMLCYSTLDGFYGGDGGTNAASAAADAAADGADVATEPAAPTAAPAAAGGASAGSSRRGSCGSAGSNLSGRRGSATSGSAEGTMSRNSSCSHLQAGPLTGQELACAFRTTPPGSQTGSPKLPRPQIGGEAEELALPVRMPPSGSATATLEPAAGSATALAAVKESSREESSRASAWAWGESERASSVPPGGLPPSRGASSSGLPPSRASSHSIEEDAAKRVSLTKLEPDDLEQFVQQSQAAPPWRRRFIMSALSRTGKE